MNTDGILIFAEGINLRLNNLVTQKKIIFVNLLIEVVDFLLIIKIFFNCKIEQFCEI